MPLVTLQNFLRDQGMTELAMRPLVVEKGGLGSQRLEIYPAADVENRKVCGDIFLNKCQVCAVFECLRHVIMPVMVLARQGNKQRTRDHLARIDDGFCDYLPGVLGRIPHKASMTSANVSIKV